ncbi:MAG TPA: GNAT family N-acetyltransferase [Candidatus Polarisedimenticolia bacterium]|nr:GNAT family N-acetyltransferase [Candidatus Polarisedimenticolia bacterium]
MEPINTTASSRGPSSPRGRPAGPLPSPGRGLRRAWRALRAGEIAPLTTMLSRKIRIVRFERMRVLRRSTWFSVPEAALTGEGIRSHQVDEAGLAMLRGAFPHNAGEYARRLRRGDRCVLVTVEGAPAGMTWARLDLSSLREKGCLLQLPPGAAWVFDTFVRPELRGRRLFQVLMDAVFGMLRAGGTAWTYLAVHHENEASVRAHRRIGFRPALTLSILMAGTCELHRIRWPSGRGKWALSRPGRRPTIAVP